MLNYARHRSNLRFDNVLSIIQRRDFTSSKRSKREVCRSKRSWKSRPAKSSGKYYTLGIKDISYQLISLFLVCFKVGSMDYVENINFFISTAIRGWKYPRSLLHARSFQLSESKENNRAQQNRVWVWLSVIRPSWELNKNNDCVWLNDYAASRVQL